MPTDAEADDKMGTEERIKDMFIRFEKKHRSNKMEAQKKREQAILNIIKEIDDRHYGKDTEHDPEEKALREKYAMGIAAQLSTIMRGN